MPKSDNDQDINCEKGSSSQHSAEARDDRKIVDSPALSRRQLRAQKWAATWFWQGVCNRNKPLQTIQSGRLQSSQVPVTSDSGYELMCTYDWQAGSAPIIRVPGGAPRWQDLTLPVTIAQDKGKYFVDQNAARIPEYPFEPIFRALGVLNPKFRFDDVDVVVNRNSLRKLLEFCRGNAVETFRVNLLTVNNTVFIDRCEKSAVEYVRGSTETGYGHGFEKTFTQYTDKSCNSSEHHRVLYYNIGEMRCVVRFEVDACYNDGESDVDGELDSISLGLSGLSISTVESIKTTAAAMTPQSATAELKSAKYPKSKGKYMPQLWFGRTPWLIIGSHNDGVFHSVDVTHAASSFSQWETQHQNGLRKLATLIRELRDAALQNKRSSLVAIYQKNESPKAIKLFMSRQRRGALPEELVTQFWGAAASTR